MFFKPFKFETFFNSMNLEFNAKIQAYKSSHKILEKRLRETKETLKSLNEEMDKKGIRWDGKHPITNKLWEIPFKKIPHVCYRNVIKETLRYQDSLKDQIKEVDHQLHILKKDLKELHRVKHKRENDEKKV